MDFTTMKKNLNTKIKLTGYSVSGALLGLTLSVTPVNAAGLDVNELKNWISGYITPLTQVLLWAVPLVAALAILIKGIGWFQKDSEGEQQKPFWSSVKGIIIVAVVLESVSLILTIFGITN